MNKYEAVMALIQTCPLVGEDVYFNFVDDTKTDANTTLLSEPYGQVVRKYVDGDILMKMTFVIQQVKPLATYSNTTANTDQMYLVKEFLDWINLQGKLKNYPDWGNCEIVDMSTNDEVKDPIFIGNSTEGALYEFPFNITYIERN